ncbi:MAG: tRNA epoxyqueuosine(34) reductase QueG [Verrucomicrobia bacterium Tous-C9LFEB]|nr:MAG: tRNA epoxyqueuosine(34) reductase QueG [Verrucomicrobia bacterium Tous-C9LFEB]
MPPTTLTATQIKDQARALGFDLCGIAAATRPAQAEYYQQWITDGRHGEMGWLARDPQRRTDPQQVLPEARSVIAVGLNHYQPAPTRRGRIATYALGEDYHTLFEEKLAAFQGWLTATAGGSHKFYADTGPVLEKNVAQLAGLGWQAKSTMLLNAKFGPWLFLGEILTTLDLPADEPARDRCGSCTRCIDVCPTQAITAPYELDARRCISYLTIELKGSIPEELRPLIGDHLYGCEECLTVCPWNRFAKQSQELRFAATASTQLDLRDYLALSPQEFKQRFAGSPILRVKRRGLLRNVCVVLGNIGTADDLPALHRALSDEEPLVREHAAWAVARIRERTTT